MPVGEAVSGATTRSYPLYSSSLLMPSQSKSVSEGHSPCTWSPRDNDFLVLKVVFENCSPLDGHAVAVERGVAHSRIAKHVGSLPRVAHRHARDLGRRRRVVLRRAVDDVLAGAAAVMFPRDGGQASRLGDDDLGDAPGGRARRLVRLLPRPAQGGASNRREANLGRRKGGHQVEK